MSKKNWSRDLKIAGDYSPVIILTRENILDWVGDSWMGSRSFGSLDSELKRGLEQEGKCWLIRAPTMRWLRIGKTVIEKELGLEIFKTHKKDRIFYLVDEAKAREAIKDLME